jgi:hypothetical protein
LCILREGRGGKAGKQQDEEGKSVHDL